MTPHVSVIIPVYNAERFFERCLHALFRQTLESLEYIFVNDATPDRSMDVLERVLDDYPARRPHVQVIEHTTNKGSGAARDSGMRRATGEYVIHCDSDDWTEPEMYETMYRAATKENADIVCCDFLAELPQCSVLNRYEAGAGTESPGALKRQQLSTVNCSLCNKLVRRELCTVNDIYPFEGINVWEDLGITVRLRFLSKKTFVLRHAFYHYNKQNEHSLISAPTHASITTEQQIPCAALLERFFIERKAEDGYRLLVERIKFQSKESLLLKKSVRDIALWRSIYPETHAWISRFPNMPSRRRMEFQLAASGWTKTAALLIDSERWLIMHLRKHRTMKP